MSGDHYFTPTPGVAERTHEVEFTIRGRTFRLTASSGVFSADRLDPGTAVLLRKAPLPAGDAPRTLLDLGCGYGPIACVLAVTAPASTVYAVDVNSRALDLVRRNAAAVGAVDRIIAATPDEVPSDVTFDEIWSNPPIRVGKAQLHGILDRWLSRLAPDGAAWLVVARHLGADSLHHWLVDRGWTVERYASQKGYRVLRTSQPSTGDRLPSLQPGDQ